MRVWTTKEAGQTKLWAGLSPQERVSLDELAKALGRTKKSVQDFLRRQLGPGNLPWKEKPRWPKEVQRTPEAVRKFVQRHRSTEACESGDDGLSVSEVARDLGVSRMSVYRLVRQGKLRRFKGKIAQSSFKSLLRNHPDAVPYRRLGRAQQEWLVLNGYKDASIVVKRPSVAGILR